MPAKGLYPESEFSPSHLSHRGSAKFPQIFSVLFQSTAARSHWSDKVVTCTRMLGTCLARMIKKFFICDPRVWFPAMAAIQPVHSGDTWYKVSETRVDARWDHRKLVNNLIQDHTALTEAHNNHWELVCRVFLRVFLVLSNVQDYVDWMIRVRRLQ